jgi:hypothetical protein
MLKSVAKRNKVTIFQYDEMYVLDGVDGIFENAVIAPPHDANHGW